MYLRGNIPRYIYKIGRIYIWIIYINKMANLH